MVRRHAHLAPVRLAEFAGRLSRLRAVGGINSLHRTRWCEPKLLTARHDVPDEPRATNANPAKRAV